MRANTTPTPLNYVTRIQIVISSAPERFLCTELRGYPTWRLPHRSAGVQECMPPQDIRRAIRASNGRLPLPLCLWQGGEDPCETQNPSGEATNGSAAQNWVRILPNAIVFIDEGSQFLRKKTLGFQHESPFSRTPESNLWFRRDQDDPGAILSGVMVESASNPSPCAVLL